LAGADAALPQKLLTATVPVIVGPTGIGKSELAFRLALALNGEIVVADSRQVYQMLDIATNKPSREARRRVKYHMIDFVDPRRAFNVAEFVHGANQAIEDIQKRGLVAIVEGGTMLYVDSLCDGFNLAGIPPDRALRSELEALGREALATRLLALDPDPGVDLNNPVRVIRAIEILRSAGPPLRALRTRTPPGWKPLRIGLRAALDVIDHRLEVRSIEQVRRGLVEETRHALDAGVPASATVLSGIGYAEALANIRGELPAGELPAAMARSNRRYARRQLRWWRRSPLVRWFELEPDPLPAILNYVQESI